MIRHGRRRMRLRQTLLASFGSLSRTLTPMASPERTPRSNSGLLYALPLGRTVTSNGSQLSATACSKLSATMSMGFFRRTSGHSLQVEHSHNYALQRPCLLSCMVSSGAGKYPLSPFILGSKEQTMWRRMPRLFRRSNVPPTTGPCPWKCSVGTPVVISGTQANKLRAGKAVKAACSACDRPVTAQTEGKDTPRRSTRDGSTQHRWGDFRADGASRRRVTSVTARPRLPQPGSGTDPRPRTIVRLLGTVV